MNEPQTLIDYYIEIFKIGVIFNKRIFKYGKHNLQ